MNFYEATECYGEACKAEGYVYQAPSRYESYETVDREWHLYNRIGLLGVIRSDGTVDLDAEEERAEFDEEE